MDRQRIVITGVGVVAPNGIGKEEFWRNCAAGVSGIKPITLFDASKYRCRWAGEVSNFQPEQYLGSKGLRNLDRTTLLALVAAKLAIEDAKLEVTDANRNDIGVVLGSTMGSIHSISEFDKEGLREGPRYVNPAQFPNTVINSPASQVAIRFGLKGLNTTISTGFTASLDAFGYAMDMLRLGRANMLLVGGVEELCIQTFLGFYKLGLLATSSNGTPPPFRPLDAAPQGTLLGEGAAFLVLEPYDKAIERQVSHYAEICGYGTFFNPDALYRLDSKGRGPSAAMKAALFDAALDPNEICSIVVSANSTKLCDSPETLAIKEIFQTSSSCPVSICSIKEMIGESFSASGILQLTGAINLPSTIETPNCSVSTMINAFGPIGVSTSLIIVKHIDE